MMEVRKDGGRGGRLSSKFFLEGKGEALDLVEGIKVTGL